MRGVWLVPFLLACAPDPCPEGLLADGLVLTARSHPVGWTRSECFDCHAAARIHRSQCLPGQPIDAEDWLVPTDCTTCHGDNGAAP